MSTREERAAARANWPVAIVPLGHDDPPTLPDGADFFSAVLELTGEAWALTGTLPPRTPRAEWPVTIVRPGA